MMAFASWYLIPSLMRAAAVARGEETPPGYSGGTSLLLHRDGAALRIRHLVRKSPACDSDALGVGDEIVAEQEENGPCNDLADLSASEAHPLLASAPGALASLLKIFAEHPQKLPSRLLAIRMDPPWKTRRTMLPRNRGGNIRQGVSDAAVSKPSGFADGPKLSCRIGLERS